MLVSADLSGTKPHQPEGLLLQWCATVLPDSEFLGRGPWSQVLSQRLPALLLLPDCKKKKTFFYHLPAASQGISHFS